MATRTAARPQAPQGHDDIPDHPARRQEIEQVLDRRGVAWRFEPAVVLGEFDDESSKRNQARIQPIIPALAERYRDAWLRGDQFPAVTAYYESGKLVRIDGNHRAEGLGMATRRLVDRDEAFVPTLATYVIEDAVAEAIEILKIEINALNGQPPSEPERILHAITLIDNGVSQRDAAAITQLSTTKVGNEYHIEVANRRARGLGVKGFERIAANNRSRLGSVFTDSAFAALAQLTLEARLGGPDVNRIVSQLSQVRTEQGQMQVIYAAQQQYRPQILATAGGVVRRQDDPHVALYRHVGGVLKVNPQTLVARITDREDRELAAKKAEEGATRLLEFAEALRG